MPEFSTAAFGRIECIRAKASADLRRKLVNYWRRVRNNRVLQANFNPKEIIPDFMDYALTVFDAKAEEHLLITNRSPQDFVEFLRTDLIPEVWSEVEGDTGLWRRMVEESLTLSSFVFPHLPGRSIKKQDYLVPLGRSVIAIGMSNRVDEHWVGRSWSRQEPNETSKCAEIAPCAVTKGVVSTPVPDGLKTMQMESPRLYKRLSELGFSEDDLIKVEAGILNIEAIANRVLHQDTGKDFHAFLDPLYGLFAALFTDAKWNPSHAENIALELVSDALIERVQTFLPPGGSERTEMFSERYGSFWVKAGFPAHLKHELAAPIKEWRSRTILARRTDRDSKPEAVKISGAQRPEGAQPATEVEDVHLGLLELVLKKRTITLEKWAGEHHFGRTTVFDWKRLRSTGKSLTGKVSETKTAEIEQAIEADAQALGLTARTDSD